MKLRTILNEALCEVRINRPKGGNEIYIKQAFNYKTVEELVDSLMPDEDDDLDQYGNTPIPVKVKFAGYHWLDCELQLNVSGNPNEGLLLWMNNMLDEEAHGFNKDDLPMQYNDQGVPLGRYKTAPLQKLLDQYNIKWDKGMSLGKEWAFITSKKNPGIMYYGKELVK